MLLIAVNRVIFFLIFKKLKFLIKIFYSMGFLNKIFIFLLKIINFTKFIIFKNLEKRNLELVSNKAIINFIIGRIYKSFSYLNSLKMLIFIIIILIILII
jgi:hypothetical protein